MENPGFFLAFIAGLLSFFSPCVLAVAPGYLAMLSGSLPLDEGSGQSRGLKFRAVMSTVFFIIGFTIVFALMGTAFSALGKFLFLYRLTFLRIGGAILIILGLFQWGILNFFTLQREVRFQLKSRLTGPVGWVLTGASFALGWTPCVGPILSMILVLAGNTQRMSTGMILLLIYSIGMAIPFFMLAIAFPTFYAWYKRILPYTKVVTFISGLLLVIIGLLLFFDQLKLISIWLNQVLGSWSFEELLLRP